MIVATAPMLVPMTRRTTLALGSGLAAGVGLGGAGLDAADLPKVYPATTGDLDVVVVGAGAAGLAAAEVLVAAGRRIRVLEARHRPGGRAFTDTVAGIPFDAGAAYVHYFERNPWVGIADCLGVALERHRGFGRGVPFRQGQRLDPGQRASLRAARERLSDLTDAVTAGTPDTSLAQLVAGEPATVREAALRYANQAIGEDPERISIVDLAMLWDGDDLVVPTGYGSLVAAAARGLPVTYDTTVKAIDWSGQQVDVMTDRGVLRAARVILTVPVGVLAAESIRFSPLLPVATQDAIGGLPMGALSKVALAFDGERFGWPSPSDAYAIDANMNFEFWPFDRNVVIATFGGDTARSIVELGEEDAVAAVLDDLVAIIGAQARRHVVGGRLSGWWMDPHARGSYAVAMPGRRSARRALAEPVGGRLFIAGEATGGAGDALGAVMSVGGATIAGREAAAAVLESLR
jgi:monoamine oxidase